MYTPPPPMGAQPASGQKSWLGRNWKWLLPGGCLGLLLAGAALIFAVVMIAMSAVKTSDVYREAFTRARTNPRIIAELGEPVEDGWFVQGTINTSGSAGQANFDFPVSGPRKSGRVFAEATRRNSQWQFTALDVTIEGMEGRHSLLGPGAPSAPGAGAPPMPPGPLPKDYESGAPAQNLTTGKPGSDSDSGLSAGNVPEPIRTKPISGGVLNLQAVSLPQPPYPAAAKAVRAGGLVTVRVTVNESGQIVSAEAVSGHPLLHAASVQAARQARFNTFMVGGKPTAVEGLLAYDFTPE